MKIRTIGLFISVTLVFVLGVAAGSKVTSDRYQSEIARIRGETAIYRSQAEKYAQTIREIRERAAQATVTEKAP